MIGVNFEDKVAMVTGAGSGIGRSVALAFAASGARLIVADVVSETGEETTRMIHNNGGKAFFVKTDVAQAREVERMVAAAVESFGRLDFACNNAGIEGVLAETADYPEEIWRKVLEVNLVGAWLCLKYQIPQMLRQGGGSIVNMSSILGQVGMANASAYVASKHGLIGLTKAAAIEYATRNIRVNAICPGFIETPMIARGGIRPGTEFYDAIRSMHAMKRLGNPDEVAGVALWLCSEAASFVTGEAILVDGGYVAQ